MLDNHIRVLRAVSASYRRFRPEPEAAEYRADVDLAIKRLKVNDSSRPAMRAMLGGEFGDLPDPMVRELAESLVSRGLFPVSNYFEAGARREKVAEGVMRILRDSPATMFEGGA